MALDEFFACYEQEPRPRLTKATVSAWCWKSAGWDPRPQSCVPAAASEKVPGRAPQTFEPSRPDHPMRHGASVQIPEVSFYPWPMRHYGERPASHPSASAGRKRRLSSHRANAILKDFTSVEGVHTPQALDHIRAKPSILHIQMAFYPTWIPDAPS